MILRTCRSNEFQERKTGCHLPIYVYRKHCRLYRIEPFSCLRSRSTVCNILYRIRGRDVSTTWILGVSPTFGPRVYNMDRKHAFDWPKSIDLLPLLHHTPNFSQPGRVCICLRPRQTCLKRLLICIGYHLRRKNVRSNFNEQDGWFCPK